MTVVAEGEPEVLEQIEKQLAKLVDVSKIQMLPADASVCRELILIKVAAKPEKFTILELARTGITGLSRGSENSLF